MSINIDIEKHAVSQNLSNYQLYLSVSYFFLLFKLISIKETKHKAFSKPELSLSLSLVNAKCDCGTKIDLYLDVN